VQEYPTAATTGWKRDLILLTLAIGLLLGYNLGNRALWQPDEGRYAEIPREMLVSGDLVTPRLNGVKYFEKPPLFYWLQVSAIKTFGLNEWALRMWPALLALIGCLATYVTGRRLYNRRTGLIGATVLATSLLYYQMGRIITLDMAVSVFLTIALFAFLLGTREPPGTRRRLYLYTFYLLAALATLTKGLIGIVIPGMIIGTWILLLNRWRLLKEIHLPTGLALFLLVAAPWHVMVSNANPEFLNFYFIHEHFLRFTTKIHRRYEPVYFFVPVLIVGLLPWVAFLAQAMRFSLPPSWGERQEHKESLFLLLWVVLIFAFFSTSDSKLVPYILPLFPPMALLLGRYLGAAWDGEPVRGLRTGFWIVLGLCTVVAAILFVMPREGAAYAKLVEYNQILSYYFYAVAVIWAVGGALTFLLSWFRFRLAFLALTGTTVAFLVALNAGLPLMDNRNSSKELAVTLRPFLAPETEVMSYHEYLQDLPVYLERRVTVVGYKGELAFGADNEDVDGWMIDEDAFWQRWQSPATVYMLTKRTIYDQLRADNRGTFVLLAESGKHVLLTNHGNRP
jgi:4-amino-4-deoxy-L-arabinose transferase-like glycosyltransferase